MDGVTGKDDRDGDLTSKIVVKGTVDTTKEGDYTITYTVTDNAGNIEVVSRIITVKKISDSNPGEDDNNGNNDGSNNGNNGGNNNGGAGSGSGNGSNGGTNSVSNSGNKLDTSNKQSLPKTGSESVMYFALAAVSLIGAGLVLAKKKVLGFKSK